MCFILAEVYLSPNIENVARLSVKASVASSLSLYSVNIPVCHFEKEYSIKLNLFK